MRLRHLRLAGYDLMTLNIEPGGWEDLGTSEEHERRAAAGRPRPVYIVRLKE